MKPIRSMMLLAAWPALAAAQAAFPTDFPAGATPLDSEALRTRLTGTVQYYKTATGSEIRLQIDSKILYVNATNFSDNGAWRVEGSALCADLKRLPPGCSEIRAVGDEPYLQRSTNKEVVRMYTK